MELKQIVFTAPNTAELLIVSKTIGENDVCVKTAFSTISIGTERANIIGDPNINASTPKTELVKFPRTVGYSSAGTVVSKGGNVTNVDIGDRVVVFWGKHANYNIVPKENVVKIEDDSISFEEAAISFIATFSLAAIRKTRLEIGESLLVLGGGILGQIAVQLANVCGAAPLIAADPKESRRKLALENGADYVFDPYDEDFVKNVKKVSGGVNVAIESTGKGSGLNCALDCMAKFGRVSLLGCTRDENFTVDYYRKVHYPGISIIGAHTNARPKIESYPGYYTHKDDIKTILKLNSLGRINFSRMISEVRLPYECNEVYSEIINNRDCPVVIQFDWREEN